MTDTTAFSDQDFDPARRFGGIARLYGAASLERFNAAHVCVVGVGGVGSWVVEALARSGVGALTLIDLDHVAESNINRQIQALGSTLGAAKVAALAARVADINPACKLNLVEDFITPDNVETLLGEHFDFVVDAIDSVRPKAAMVARCRQLRVPVVVVGAAGGQVDPTLIRRDDLACTTQDPLLSKVRSRLRRDYGFPRDGRGKFGVAAVYSTEPIRRPIAAGEVCEVGASPAAHGLNCAGFGSSMCVTAGFAMVAASVVLRGLAAA